METPQARPSAPIVISPCFPLEHRCWRARERRPSAPMGAPAAEQGCAGARAQLLRSLHWHLPKAAQVLQSSTKKQISSRKR